MRPPLINIVCVYLLLIEVSLENRLLRAHAVQEVLIHYRFDKAVL